MIEIKTTHDENGVGTMSIEMEGRGLDLLAEACAVVRSLADSFEKKGGPIVKATFVNTIKDDEFWKVKYREDGESKAEEIANA